MKKSFFLGSLSFIFILMLTACQKKSSDGPTIDQSIDPATLMWYDEPAVQWEDALPVGNGRLGAMVFGKYGEERIQLNEETYWSGGPYSHRSEGWV